MPDFRYIIFFNAVTVAEKRPVRFQFIKTCPESWTVFTGNHTIVFFTFAVSEIFLLYSFYFTTSADGLGSDINSNTILSDSCPLSDGSS